jgi:hypothetical protein
MKHLLTGFLLVLFSACASTEAISVDGGTGGSQTGSGGSATGAATGQTGGVTGQTGGVTGQTGGAIGQTGGATGSAGHSGGASGSAGHSGGSTGTGGAVVHTGGAGGTGRGGAGGKSGGGTGGATGGSAGAGGPGQVLFLGDFETGDLSQWPYVERCATNRVVVYSTSNAPSGAPAPRAGKYAVQFHVLDTDVAPCTSTENPRAELDSPDLFSSGDDRWEAWSMYIPTSHPAPNCTNCPNGTWLQVQEDYGAPFDGPPSLGWYLDLTVSPNKFSMDRGTQYNDDQPWLSPIITGQWVDFTVHKKFSNTNDGTGFVEAWENGNPITFSTCNCTHLSTQTMHSTQTKLAFYMTAYRAAGLFSSFDIYYDEVRIGTTQASVQIP